jgi:hypothetical protein
MIKQFNLMKWAAGLLAIFAVATLHASGFFHE